MSHEALVEELKSLRDEVVGVSDSILATADGLLVAADSTGIHAESVAALAAASLGLGRRIATEVSIGGLREVVTRGQGGQMAIYAVGDEALLVVLGDEGLDMIDLHARSRATVDHLATLLAGGTPV